MADQLLLLYYYYYYIVLKSTSFWLDEMRTWGVLSRSTVENESFLTVLGGEQWSEAEIWKMRPLSQYVTAECALYVKPQLQP